MEPGSSMPHSQGLFNNPYTEPNQPNSSHFLRSILILSSHLRLGFFKHLYVYTLTFLKELVPSSILATWPSHRNLLDLVILTILGKRYKIWSSSLRGLLHFPFASLLGPNIHLRIQFPNTLSLRSSFNVRDHASHPYSTTGNTIVLYARILISKFLREKLRSQKYFLLHIL